MIRTCAVTCRIHNYMYDRSSWDVRSVLSTQVTSRRSFVTLFFGRCTTPCVWSLSSDVVICPVLETSVLSDLSLGSTRWEVSPLVPVQYIGVVGVKGVDIPPPNAWWTVPTVSNLYPPHLVSRDPDDESPVVCYRHPS